ncbi:MAG: class I SAM-dependent methyltransferase [Gemmatimonadetes bacterium]|nr:class I SAM-dependent methyltransferase [Gemmatimonadota bacterium]
MSWFVASIYDRWMRPAETACLVEWRAALVRGLAGDVLEIGAGTGAMLAHYPSTITRLVLVEPDRHMRRRLEARCRAMAWPHAEVSDAAVEQMRLPDHSFDAVVCSLVLCSVPSMSAALDEVFRVLKPGGRFCFLEHVAAEKTSTCYAWQRRLEPAWRLCAGNCHLTRDTEHAICAAGFQAEQITRESLRKAMPLMRPSIRGIARKPLRTEDV